MQCSGSPVHRQAWVIKHCARATCPSSRSGCSSNTLERQAIPMREGRMVIFIVFAVFLYRPVSVRSQPIHGLKPIKNALSSWSCLMLSIHGKARSPSLLPHLGLDRKLIFLSQYSIYTLDRFSWDTSRPLVQVIECSKDVYETVLTLLALN